MNSTHGGFTEQERNAMQERAAELKTEAKRPRGGKKAAEELDLLHKIQGMAEPDRLLAERIHVIVREEAPELAPKLWYGQPAWAKQGKVICFFRSGHDDGERYSTFGFTQHAALDDTDGMWASSFAVTALSDAAVEQVAGLVRRAVS